MKSLSLFVLLTLIVSSYSEERTYIGIPKPPTTIETYTAKPGVTLLTFCPFNDKDTVTPYDHFGALDFNPSDGALRVPVRTLKRNPKSGTIRLTPLLALGQSSFILSVSRTLPSGNPDLGSALMFFPETCQLHPQTGLPSTYIRYMKRSKVEVVEYKLGGGKPRLMWARNEAVESGATETVSLALSAKSVRLTLQDSLLFSDDNPIPQYTQLRCGIWAFTKGNTPGGGNLVFDRILLESTTP